MSRIPTKTGGIKCQRGNKGGKKAKTEEGNLWRIWWWESHSSGRGGSNLLSESTEAFEWAGQKYFFGRWTVKNFNLFQRISTLGSLISARVKKSVIFPWTDRGLQLGSRLVSKDKEQPALIH